jgi:hypothetical protein
MFESFRDYAPTKTTLAWTAAGASALTMALGFALGGWVTGGSAERMAAEAADGARAELAANVCAANFAASAVAAEQQQELLALASYRQRGFVQEQLWARMPGETEVNRQVADLCAKKIAAMGPESFAAAEAAVVESSEVDPG